MKPILLLLFCLGGELLQAFQPVDRSIINRRSTTTTFERRGEDNDPRTSTTMIWSRRHALLGMIATTLATISWSPPVVALADDEITNDSNQVAREQRITKMLRDIPTFTIVDAAGVPYMVVGDDAKVTAYFFTTYREANRILQLARGTANDDDNPWNKARISTVPLDTAVSLTLKSRDGSMRSYFQVAASAQAIDDALNISGMDDLAEQKVPLFYTSDRPNSLFLERPSKHSNVKVTELYAILQSMAASDDLQDWRIVAPNDSAKKAKECQRGAAPPFVLGERNVIL